MPCLISSSRLSRVGFSGSTSWATIFQWTLFAAVLLTLNATPTPEIPTDDVDMMKRANFNEKRNWQSLQGAWGKRSLGADLSAELTEADDDVYFAERRVPLMPDTPGHPSPVLKYSLVYIKNAGGILDHLANGDNENPQESSRKIDNNNLQQYDGESDDNENEVSPIMNGFANDKRAWKSMNIAWGKRRSAPQWNKFRGAWGKREPGWNNLKGMWGKRASKDWQKLHGSWGKRSMDAN